MAIRRSGMTLGGKLSLGYLCATTFLFVTGGRLAEWWSLMVFGFPLLYAPWVYEQAFGEIGQPRPAVAVTVGVLLWVANAYLWGHTIAAVVGWLSRRSGSRRVEQGTPNEARQPTLPPDAPP